MPPSLNLQKAAPTTPMKSLGDRGATLGFGGLSKWHTADWLWLRAALPRLYSWLPVCWKILMPPAVLGLPGRAVPVGVKETTIYLFSEASLFLRCWQVPLSSGCGYVSVTQWAICLPQGPGWFTSKAVDSVWRCHSLHFYFRFEPLEYSVLCSLPCMRQAFHVFFFPFIFAIECLFTIELHNTSAISLTLLISSNEDCFAFYSVALSTAARSSSNLCFY